MLGSGQVDNSVWTRDFKARAKPDFKDQNESMRIFHSWHAAITVFVFQLHSNSHTKARWL